MLVARRLRRLPQLPTPPGAKRLDIGGGGVSNAPRSGMADAVDEEELMARDGRRRLGGRGVGAAARAFSGVGVALLVAGCGDEASLQAKQHQRVIFILLDAARADRFSCYGYEQETTPHIDALAEDGVRFASHFTNAPNTRASLPNILLSRYFAPPLFHSNRDVPLESPDELFRDFDPQCTSLPKAFESAGFATAAISAHTWTRPGTKFAEQFQEMYDLPGLVDYEAARGFPTGQQVVDAAIDWMAGHNDDSFFLYLHLMDTHFPHFFEEDAQELFGATEYDSRRFTGRGVPKNDGESLTDQDRVYLDALYDGSLRYADRQVGRLIEHLQQDGMENTTVLITADHGEMLLEQLGRFGHTGWTMTRALLEIPWVLHAPGRLEPAVVDGVTGAVDLMPTLLEVAGVPLPSHVVTDGRSQLAVARGEEPGDEVERSRFGSFQKDERLSMKNPEVWLGGSTMPRERDALDQVTWFDLQSDPQEVEDRTAVDLEATFARLQTYREAMAAKWQRFEEARISEPPSHTFAVSAKFFGVLPKTPARLAIARLHELEPGAMPDGWILARHVASHGLFGRQGAKARRIEIQIPSGNYLAYIGVRGEIELRIGKDGEWQRVSGSEMDTAPPHGADERPIGPVTVVDEQFLAWVRPASSHSGEIEEDADWLLVKHFGFVPEGVVDGAGSLDEDARKRLIEIGYLEAEE